VLEVLGNRAGAHITSSGDRLIRAAARRKLEDLYLALRQVVQAVGTRGPHQGGLRTVPVAHPSQCVAERCADRRQQRAVVLGEVRASPVQGDRGEAAIRRVGQVERHLVLDRNMPKEL